MYNEINDFLDKYKELYQDFTPQKIRKKIKYGYNCDTDQIICHLNLIKKKESAYYKFLKLVMSYFNLNTKSVAELSCGFIPTLSATAKKYTKNIVAINKKILFRNYHNVKTIEADLQSNYDLSPYDLIIAFRPCYPTENIVDLCFQYKKDFVIYLCPCVLQPKISNKQFETIEQWHSYLLSKVTANKEYQITIVHSRKLQDNMPIIIAKYNHNLVNKF